MMRKQIAVAGGIALAMLMLIPAAALAQSAIAGVVRDTSGAVLPGVTVEAASPVLIEKVRSSVSGADGTYTIQDLRPGVYSVTFSLAGFNTIKRDGIELPAAFTATVSVSMQVGAIEETITVTGSAPLVDTHNASSQVLFTTAMLETLPSNSKSPQSFAALTPGVRGASLSQAPGGVDDMGASAHGGAASDYTIDGMTTATINGMQGGSITFRVAQAYVSEIAVMTGGGTAESSYGNMITNVIPKEGGNTFSGSFYAEYTGDSLAASNLTPELEKFGFTPNSLTKTTQFLEISPAFGGRIIKDKLWFFSSFKDYRVVTIRQSIYDNLTPRGFAYTPDLNNPAKLKLTQTSRNTRLTWQAAQKHKFNVFVDNAPQIAWHRGRTLSAPEATNYSPYLPNIFMSGGWKSPITNQWLLEASIAHNASNYDQRRHIPETCLCTAPPVGYDVISKFDALTNIMWGASSTLGGGAESNLYGPNDSRMLQWQGSATYITGSHSLKFGLRHESGSILFAREPNGALAYTLRGPTPNSIRMYATPFIYTNEIHPNMGVFVQDQWVHKRLTLTAGLRYDYFTMSSPETHLGKGFFVGARDFAETTLVTWHDVNPRLGISYDLFGDAKTAIKASFGRFVASQDGAGTRGLGRNNPIVRSVLEADRTWTDNGNYSVDCDLSNPLLNFECAQISNLNFGQNNPNALVYDPKLMTDLRPFHYETTAQIQRQITNGVSVTLGYYRRDFKNFTVNDNTFVGPSDFSQYCVTAPADDRLPGGGNYQICGLYDVSRELFGRTQIVVRDASQFGKQTQTYNGFDLTEQVRLKNGILVTGGLSTDTQSNNSCFVVDSPGALRFCDAGLPLQQYYTFTGFVPLPFNTVIGAVYRDRPGPEITASRNYTNAQILPSLGRDLSNGANGTVNIALIEPGTMYGKRQRQLDLRFSKRLRVGRTRLTGNLDVSNVFNTSAVTSQNNTYGANWQVPSAIQFGRFFKLGAQFDF
jgi:outer membrane receptor protein involved in Fe transport